MDLTDFQHLEWEEQVLYFIPDMRFVLLDYVQLTRRGHHIVNNHEFFTGELKPLKGYGMVYEIHAENTMMYTSTSCVNAFENDVQSSVMAKQMMVLTHMPWLILDS